MCKKDNIKFCIVIPTNNHYDIIKYWINNKLKETIQYDVDVIVFDNVGNSEETKNLVENCSYDNIYYEYYDEIPQYPATIDEKVKFILAKTSEKYDIVWICRDRSFPNLSETYNLILDAYNNNNDFVIVNPHPVLGYSSKTYQDAAELAKYEYGEMTSLGSIVFFKQIAKDISNNFPIIEKINLGLWLPTALFQCIADKKIKATKIYVNSFTYFLYTEPSHWLKNKSAVTLYTKWLPNIIKNLPSVYEKVKGDILTMRYWTMPLWNTHLLIYLRASGNFNIIDIIIKLNILLKITKFKIFKMLYYSLIPQPILNKCLKEQISFKKFLKNIVKDIFSVRNDEQRTHKVVTILGVKIKFKRKRKN